jgi:AraC family transcriptional regulator
MEVNFKLGQFYGDPRIAVTSASFDFRAQSATAREEDVETHSHHDAHFVLVLSGAYVSSAQGADDFRRAPSLVFNPPGTIHRDRFVKGIGRFVTISLAIDAYCELSSAASVCRHATLVRTKGALAAAFGIAREIRAYQDPFQIESLAWELMTCVESKARAETKVPIWALRAYEAIMDRSMEARLEVRHIAADVNMHPVHVARVFRECWGCSPGELIRWRRVDKAVDLLRHSRKSGAEIAAAVGFVDQSHMNRAFRTIFGVAPSAFREANVSWIQAKAPTTE